MSHQFNILYNKKILLTGGPRFINSKLCESLLKLKAKVTIPDNFITGHKYNIASFLTVENFKMIEGDIRVLAACNTACKVQNFVLHQAALGSVPRSINDPITSKEVNERGFLNMLVAARDADVKRFVYAASSLTYGYSKVLLKVEDIRKPLLPYAITKYVNELYVTIFHISYDLDNIELRYFNVFGRLQDPNGAYAAVIPLFIKQFMTHQSPIINGDGSYSRDFTYIDNVVQINLLSLTTENKETLNHVYNTAVGDRTTLVQLTDLLKKYLSAFDPEIAKVEVTHGPNRKGDNPHSLGFVEKAEKLLRYKPMHAIETDIKEAVEWYWANLM